MQTPEFYEFHTLTHKEPTKNYALSCLIAPVTQHNPFPVGKKPHSLLWEVIVHSVASLRR
jgi:hypothetical protein